jgi:AcrR family transcriptional regulator
VLFRSYFGSKEELFYAVVLRGMRRLVAYVEAAAGAADEAGRDDTGRERLRRIQVAAYRCTRDYPATFRLMDDVRYASSDPDKSPTQREIVAINGRLYALMRDAIEAGRRDGSVRGDLSGPGELFAYFFVTTGAYARLAGLGELYAARFGTTADALAEAIMVLTDRLVAPAEESTGSN